jgi:3-dehydroquinate synthase
MTPAFRSEMIAQRIAVPFDYPVYFTRDLFNPGNPLLAKVLDRKREPRVHRVLVCLDSGVASARPGLAADIRSYFAAHAHRANLAGAITRVPGGERAKNDVETARRILEWITDRRLCRQSFVLAIGGGSVLDAVGFAASLVHRGLRLIRIPTTVEAQDDVGVGVKTGLDAYGTKNLLGTFAPPFAVLNDFDFLDSLPKRDWLAGIAEAFKVAIIKDARFFDFLCAHARRLALRDMPAMEALIRRCARLHLVHIRKEGDPFEMGAARPLDFGHWSAHELEVMSQYTLKHGEAVAIGIALDSFYAMRRGLINRRELNRILTGLRACGLPVWDTRLATKAANGAPAILAGLERFREHLGGELSITLPVSIGRRTEVDALDGGIIAEGIAYLKHHHVRTRSTRPCRSG